MADPSVQNPDTVAATGDPGDDIARRFRYQWTYAAILCCTLLDETEGIEEVFCEHHEDVLIKHIDETFSGLQIKTRASDQDAWKTSDDSVKSSFSKFAKLEALFPGRFRAYHFLTNHLLYSAGNGKDLRYVLREISSVISLGDLSKPVKKFLIQVTSEASCTTEVAFAALKKARASDELPKLSDIEVRLVNSLAVVWPRATDCTHASVVQAARRLASECCRASSLAHQDVLPAYLPVTLDPAGRELAERLEYKRFDQLRVLDLLERGLSETEPLFSNPETFVEPGTGAIALLRQKLDAGGFSCVSRNSAEDLRDKADYLGIVWTKKHGREQGLQQYGHVRSLVLSDAAGAFEATKKDGDPFGVNMLSELRSRFHQRRTEGSNLYDCSNEHLEGFAYSLTSECKVQWSLARPWEDK